jgi:O-antigen ligase
VTVDRAVRLALGSALLAFLVVGDLWLRPGSPWHVLRLPLLGLAAAAAAVVIIRRPPVLGTVLRFPLVFFSVFAVLDLVASLAADRPLPALRYAAGYVAIEIVAVAAASMFAERTLVVGLLASLVVKTGLSLAVAASPFAWWVQTRFMGLLGNPNPMGAAAGLTYLLIVLHGWYDWPRPRSRAILAAVGVAATATLSVTHSVSALVATLTTLVVLAPFCRVRDARRTERVAWAIVAAAMLLPLAMRLGGSAAVPPRLTAPTVSVGLRSGWWAMLLEVVWRHPWLGYGAGSTRSLGVAGAPGWGTSAHNLYLEAAVYAGIPAAIAMALFVIAAVLAVMATVARPRGGVHAGLAIPIVFYAVLSLVEPVLLNGAPSSLVVPLVVAAVCAARVGGAPLPGSQTLGRSTDTRLAGGA